MEKKLENVWHGTYAFFVTRPTPEKVLTQHALLKIKYTTRALCFKKKLRDLQFFFVTQPTPKKKPFKLV